jgi:hypothetical protein
LHPSAVGHNEIATLGTVHRTAASQADQQINAILKGEGGTVLHVARRWILLGVIKLNYFETSFTQRIRRPAGMTHCHQVGIGHEQSTVATQISSKLTEPTNRPRPEYDTRQRLKIEITIRRNAHVRLRRVLNRSQTQ